MTLAPAAAAASEVAPQGDEDASGARGEVAPRRDVAETPEPSGNAGVGASTTLEPSGNAGVGAPSEGAVETTPEASGTVEATPDASGNAGVVAPPPAPPRDAVAPSSREGELAASTRREHPGALLPSGRGESRLSRYLQRPVRYGVRFLDHGVLQPAISGGWPHGYRLELSLGLLDHLTIGATAHWLPGQSRPHVAPIVALAILRGRYYELGLWYFWSLFPPPRKDIDPATPSYPRSAQWLLATASFGQAWLTGGFDAGVVRARVNDPAQDPLVDTSNPSTIRWRFGGGLHLRAGTRRWGFTAQVLVPQLTAELRFDVRFGLFEKRSKGGWKPYGMAEDWDRGAPW